MKCRVFFIFVLLMACPSGIFAQKGAFGRALKKAASSVQRSSRPAAVKTAAARLAREDAAMGGSPARDMLENYWKNLPPSLSPSAVRRNQDLQQTAILNFVERDTYLALNQALKNRAVVYQAYDNLIPYETLIPSDSRVILLGEVHEQNRIEREVLSAVLLYQRAHPEKTVYYASEFADDLSRPGDPPLLLKAEDVNKTVRKRPFYRRMTRWLIQGGVKAVGLEAPAVSDAAIADHYLTAYDSSPAVAHWASPVGIEERNIHWAGVVENILRRDPSAVVFVHAGMGHTNYNEAASLARMLKKYRPFVVEYNYALGAHMNALLERHAPFPRELKDLRFRLREKDKRAFYNLLLVRRMKDKRWALAAGCDMHVFFHDWVKSK